jgi:cytochrome c2
VLPQGNMSFQGFRDNAQNARDVVAYLRRNQGG